MDSRYDRVVRALEKRRAQLDSRLANTGFALRLPDRDPIAFGKTEPRFTVVVNVVLGFAAMAVMMRTLRWRGHVFAPAEGLATEPSGSPPATSEPTDSRSRSTLPR